MLRITRKKIIVLAVLALLTIFYFFSLPKKLFTAPYSTVLQSSSGKLLSASIADDGQWRFPESDTVPQKFIDAITTFEDKRFYYHPGVDVLSLARALRQNIKAGKVVSGGSTLTMQVIRLSRNERSRSVFEKTIECILATRLELRFSKNEILALYAAHAPFGGNVVGLEAACWRYFGRNPKNLSWAEAALLAVLPNSPSMMHPGRNRAFLKTKRDRLLDKLKDAGKFDQFTCDLAKAEEIAEEPMPLPRYARHLLTRIMGDGLKGTRLTSSVDYDLQIRIEQILNDHRQRLKANQVHNIAALLLDVNTGEVKAYAGNVSSGGTHGDDVDVIMAPRSTGSILKPMLYAACLDEGNILQRSLLSDFPVFINGFAPKNFSHQFDGAVHADQALIRSLNVPAVQMLKDYRYEKFHKQLQRLGMTTLTKSPDHYGLSLILGGAEGKLWDIAGIYASMARCLNAYFQFPGKNRYDKTNYRSPSYSKVERHELQLEETSLLSAAALYQTFDVLKEVYRPGEESGWKYFDNSKKIAWKTGTSFGFRDAWAVGVTPGHVVAIWVGNADGEGRPGLTGTEAAAPIMFDIFSLLPDQSWFQVPLQEMQLMITCKESGFIASPKCNNTDTVMHIKSGVRSGICPYHKTIHVSRDLKYQVHSGCADINEIVNLDWFILPPVQEYYFKSTNLSYKTLPPFRHDCLAAENITAMDMIYPKNHTRIFIPREIDGVLGNSVFELAHRDPRTTVFWHLDGKYLGSTKMIHHMAVSTGEGKHMITAVDESGRSIERHFEVISKLN
jgi:penicillin-binding protein 1C